MRPRADDRGVVPSEDFERFFTELSPHIQGIGLKPVRWSNLPSPHMTPYHMFRLARDIDKALFDHSVLGAVIIHGTDVLVESAYMADFTLSSPKPVVFTGSMRYYSETGYDGIRNLLNSIKACILLSFLTSNYDTCQHMQLKRLLNSCDLCFISKFETQE